MQRLAAVHLWKLCLPWHCRDTACLLHVPRLQGAVINQIKELLGVSIRISKKGVSSQGLRGVSVGLSTWAPVPSAEAEAAL